MSNCSIAMGIYLYYYRDHEASKEFGFASNEFFRLGWWHKRKEPQTSQNLRLRNTRSKGNGSDLNLIYTIYPR